jgi:hypothetical protein
MRTTPTKALGVADKAWSIGQLVEAALTVAPATPTETPPDRRRKFTVIEGGKPFFWYGRIDGRVLLGACRSR